MSLFGQAPFISGNVFGIAENNRQPDGNLIIREPVPGVPASGTLKIIGFENIVSGHVLQATGSANRELIVGNSADTSTKFYFTGSTDTELYNEFTASFLSASSQYTITYETSSATYSMALQSNDPVSGARSVSGSVTNVNADDFTIYTTVLVTTSSVSQPHVIFNMTSSDSISSNPADATHYLYIKTIDNTLYFN